MYWLKLITFSPDFPAAERPDPFYTEEGEIEELNKLLPEMKEKVTDMEEMKKDSKDRLQKAAKVGFPWFKQNATIPLKCTAAFLKF